MRHNRLPLKTLVLVFLLLFDGPNKLILPGASAKSMNGKWEIVDQSYGPVEKLMAVCRNAKHYSANFKDGLRDALIFGGRSDGIAAKNVYEYISSDLTWKEMGVTGVSEVPPLYSAGISEIGYTVYVFGGNLDAKTINKDLWMYFGKNQTWLKQTEARGSRAPQGRTRLSLVAFEAKPQHNASAPQNCIGERLYPEDISDHRKGCFLVMFGLTELEMLNDVWLYDPSSPGEWKMVSNGRGPTPRFDQCCSYSPSNRSVICFGGTDAFGDSNDTWSLSVDSFQWLHLKTKGSSPTPRRLTHCTVWKEKLVVHGGLHSLSGTVAPTDVHVLDLATLEWITVPQPPFVETREGGVLCTTGKGPWLLGGISGGRLYNDVLQLDSKFVFQLVNASQREPPKRSAHCAQMVGAKMYVLFGRNQNGVLNDIWALETSNNTWTEVIPFGLSPSGRYGAAIASLGNLIFIHGGILSDGKRTSEFWRFNIIDRTFRRVEEQNSPPARAFHGMTIVRDPQEAPAIVVYGGTTDIRAERSSNQMYYYSLQVYTWFPVEVLGDMPPGHNSFFMTTDLETSLTTIMGGFSTLGALQDRWEFESPSHSQVNKSVAVAFKRLISTNVAGSVRFSERDSQRGQMAGAGYGNRYILCGGAISYAFSSRDNTSCYQYDKNTGENSPMQPMPVNTYLATAVYYGRTMYVFGGHLVRDGVKVEREYLNILQLFQFNSDLMCPMQQGGYKLRDENCQYCSSGSEQPHCYPVPKGYYTRNPFTVREQCPVGRYGIVEGAQMLRNCQICPAGTYQNQTAQVKCIKCSEGSTCPIGSKSETKFRPVQREKLIEAIPQEFKPMPVPMGFWYAYAGATLGVLLFCILLYLYTTYQKAVTLKHYITPTADELLRKIFDEFFDSGIGLNEDELFSALSDPHLGVHGLTPEKCCDLFRKHDEDGSNACTYDEFQLIIVELINLDMLDPFEDSPCAITGTRKDNPGSGFSFKSLDSYTDSHRIGKIGDPIRLQTNATGGFLSLFYYLAILIVVGTLLTTFVYDNITETYTSMPRNVVSWAANGTSTRNFIVTFYVSGLNYEQCVTAAGACQRKTTTDAQGFSSNTSTRVGGVTRCAFNGDPLSGICTVTWSCQYCGLKSDTGSVELLFSDSTVYASRMIIEVDILTGVSEITRVMGDRYSLSSSVQWTIEPGNPKEVFKGLPTTNVFAALTPTRFQTPISSFDQTVHEQTGYHTRKLSDRTLLGRTTDESEFETLFGFSVRVNFINEENTLIINRHPRQTIIQLISSIAGALSGLGCLLVAILLQIDNYVHRQEVKSEKEPKGEEDRAEKSKEQKYLIEKDGSITANTYAQDRKMIFPLLTLKMSFGVATEILALCRRVISEEGIQQSGKTLEGATRAEPILEYDALLLAKLSSQAERIKALEIAQEHSAKSAEARMTQLLKQLQDALLALQNAEKAQQCSASENSKLKEQLVHAVRQLDDAHDAIKQRDKSVVSLRKDLSEANGLAEESMATFAVIDNQLSKTTALGRGQEIFNTATVGYDALLFTKLSSKAQVQYLQRLMEAGVIPPVESVRALGPETLTITEWSQLTTAPRDDILGEALYPALTEASRQAFFLSNALCHSGISRSLLQCVPESKIEKFDPAVAVEYDALLFTKLSSHAQVQYLQLLMGVWGPIGVMDPIEVTDRIGYPFEGEENEHELSTNSTVVSLREKV